MICFNLGSKFEKIFSNKITNTKIIVSNKLV
jgi:hypothetical protein